MSKKFVKGSTCLENTTDQKTIASRLEQQTPPTIKPTELSGNIEIDVPHRILVHSPSHHDVHGHDCDVTQTYKDHKILGDLRKSVRTERSVACSILEFKRRPSSCSDFRELFSESANTDSRFADCKREDRESIDSLHDFKECDDACSCHLCSCSSCCDDSKCDTNNTNADVNKVSHHDGVARSTFTNRSDLNKCE